MAADKRGYIKGFAGMIEHVTDDGACGFAEDSLRPSKDVSHNRGDALHKKVAYNYERNKVIGFGFRRNINKFI